MNLSQAIVEVKRGLGYRTTLDSSITAAIQSVQRTLERGTSLPDFLLVYDAEITVTADTAAITLPERFLRLHDDFEMYYVDSDEGRVSLPIKNEAEARSTYGSITDSTHGKVWARRGNTAGILIPTPTQSATYYLTYYRGDVELTVGSQTNLWLTHLPDLIIGQAGMETLGSARDKDAVAYFQQRLVRGERSRLAGIVDAELQGRALIMGRNK